MEKPIINKFITPKKCQSCEALYNGLRQVY